MHFVYHPELEPRKVDTKTYHELLSDGWYDSPAKVQEVIEKDLKNKIAHKDKQIVELKEVAKKSKKRINR